MESISELDDDLILEAKVFLEEGLNGSTKVVPFHKRKAIYRNLILLAACAGIILLVGNLVQIRRAASVMGDSTAYEEASEAASVAAYDTSEAAAPIASNEEENSETMLGSGYDGTENDTATESESGPAVMAMRAAITSDEILAYQKDAEDSETAPKDYEVFLSGKKIPYQQIELTEDGTMLLPDAIGEIAAQENGADWYYLADSNSDTYLIRKEGNHYTFWVKQ